MKKSIFITVIGLAAVSAYSQGAVNFSNYASSTQTYGVLYSGGPASGMYAGPEMNAILLYGSSSDTLVSQLQPVAGSSTALGLGVVDAPGALGTGAGWFSGGAFTIDSSNPGTVYAFAIEITGTYLGQQYIGYSGVFNSASGASALLPPGSLNPSLYGLGTGINISVTPVPEPTTLALAGLGGLASLVAFRRKQV